VLGLGVEGPAYATHLLDIARNFRKARRFIDPSFPAPAMARSSSFERRVRAMLNTDRNRMPVSRRVGICTVLALLGITLPVAGLLASSQGVGTTTFSGSVMDAVGRVIPNLTLVLTSRQARTTHETKSDGSGHFAFPGLLPGEYIIEVRKPGFDPVQGRVMLDPGEDLEQDVALQLGSVQETITISTGDTAGPPLPAPPPPAATDRRVAPPPPPPPPPPATAQQPPVDDSCSQAAVGGCIQPPVKLTHVPPQYPARQRDASVEGTVNVEGRIGTDGYLKELRLSAPAEPEFVTATLDALSAWQFAPTRLGGVPVETRIKATPLSANSRATATRSSGAPTAIPRRRRSGGRRCVSVKSLRVRKAPGTAAEEIEERLCERQRRQGSDVGDGREKTWRSPHGSADYQPIALPRESCTRPSCRGRRSRVES